MKILFAFILVLALFIPSHGAGEPAKEPPPPKDPVEIAVSQQGAADAVEDKEKLLAEQKVRNLPGRHGITVDLYISKMASIPDASDLGWQVHKVENGYEVVRQIQKGLKVFSFRWKVSDSGEITPLNQKAENVTKPVQVKKKPTS